MFTNTFLHDPIKVGDREVENASSKNTTIFFFKDNITVAGPASFIQLCAALCFVENNIFFEEKTKDHAPCILRRKMALPKCILAWPLLALRANVAKPPLPCKNVFLHQAKMATRLWLRHHESKINCLAKIRVLQKFVLCKNIFLHQQFCIKSVSAVCLHFGTFCKQNVRKMFSKLQHLLRSNLAYL